ncbi:plastocyanin/azurin family copper-binding protein [Wenyingzhuangia sp. IMCC45574]
MKNSNKTILALGVLLFSQIGFGQNAKKISEYYKIVDVPIPNEVKLEVGGLALTDDDKLGVSTRRGEVWLIDQPYSPKPTYKLFAQGMHEALGLGYRNNGFYLSQRGELTRLIDKNGDDVADVYKTVFSWPLNANYHGYSYGPKFFDNGDMLLTLNLTWEGGGKSPVRWRGWMIKVHPNGEMTPIATGLRSPAGYAISPEGDIFYSENQGDWVGSGNVTHIEVGDFVGHPEGLKWTDDPKSPLKLKPEDIKDKSGLSIYEYAKKVPELKAPAVWLPHTVLGVSTSDILYDTTGGKFGPFEGQQFVGDQGHSKIFRVAMEKVNGVYQGAVFPFVDGFSSGILRMIWGSDNSMFVGMTSRGWASTGKKPYGLQRLVWTGKTPFEIKTMKALDDGFELEFTKPINKEQAADLSKYKVTTFTYLYHKTYGSPITDKQNAMVHNVVVSEDGLKAKLIVHGMRLGYIHQLVISGLNADNGEKLLHNKAYYTLNEVPCGYIKTPKMEMKMPTKKIEQPKRVTMMPHDWGEEGADEKISIGTVPGLKYDTKEIRIKRNSKVELTLNNNDDMIHNVVVTKPGANTPLKVGEMALKLGLDGPDLNYVPFTGMVIAHTGAVGPESSETVYFNAPNETGTYWLVCTFPGHSNTMRAKLIVE